LKIKLGNAAANLEMMEVKHSNVLRLTPNVRQSFILYNSARLENLLASFHEKNYPLLPPLEDVNLDLLTQEGEWELLKYMLTLPDVLDKSIGDIKRGQIAIHTLYKYLSGFVTSFSNYYSKKKILVENRSHLIPVIHAKIHFLLAIQKCLNLVLDIFDIEPVSFM
jgi:arginyl-tRNA synthetase